MYFSPIWLWWHRNYVVSYVHLGSYSFICVIVTVRLPVTATKIQSWANTNTLDSAGYKHTFIGTQTLPTYCTAITTTSVKIHTLKIPTLKGLPFNTWQALYRAGQWQTTCRALAGWRPDAAQRTDPIESREELLNCCRMERQTCPRQVGGMRGVRSVYEWLFRVCINRILLSLGKHGCLHLCKCILWLVRNRDMY